ncbi:hypothetical protein ACFQT0_03600 [Hymenobacter humi]|uniref:Uncharacterized protein n=1 Tax=Hymenobacter humi TaxID=1411620 RepID=A0ABW2U136_9BACT
MIITTIADLSLQHDAALGLLRVEWASGQDMRTFRASAGHLLQLVEELGVRQMLMDINSFPDISVYDQVWLGTNWMPGLVQLPLERLVLAINRRRVHNQAGHRFADYHFSAVHQVRYPVFLTAVPGLHWLSDFSDRMPALLAEWHNVHGSGPFPGPLDVAEPRPLYRAGR